MEFSNFYKMVSEGIVAIDSKGIVLYSNYLANKLFCREDDTLTGKKLMKYIGNDPVNDKFADSITDVIFSEENKISRKVYYQNAQGRFALFMSSIRVKTEEFRGIIIVFSDISELEQLEETEQKLQDRLNKNTALKKQNEILTDAFKEHLDDAVIEELLNSPSGIGIHTSEKKMSLFMLMSPKIQALINVMDAQDYLKMINHYYDVVISIIKKNNGTIFELHSDSILVGFGAPKLTTEYTDDAFRAASEIQRSMSKINAWNEKNSLPEIGVKLGIHTDIFPIGVIGGTSVSKYNVFGRNINYTARMTVTADDGDVVLSESAKEDLQLAHEVAEQYEFVPKGISKPMKVYKVRLA